MQLAWMLANHILCVCEFYAKKKKKKILNHVISTLLLILEQNTAKES